MWQVMQLLPSHDLQLYRGLAVKGPYCASKAGCFRTPALCAMRASFRELGALLIANTAWSPQLLHAVIKLLPVRSKMALMP